VLSGTARDEERPATFRDVLASGEFRSVYAASALSWVGDYVAKAAITALVFDQTSSVVASASAFAISYAPWLLGGPILASLAERYSYRTVMVWCDVVRAVLMCLVAMPLLPVPAILALLLASGMFAPPFEAARSATLPAILAKDRYVVGLALHTSTYQPMQAAGYFLGAALSGSLGPRFALVLNAATFALSALLIRYGTQLRDPGLDPGRRTHLLAETLDGFRLVFTRPALRAIVVLVFCVSLFPVVPEGLAAAWSRELVSDGDKGLAQGVIMASVPIGSIVGALLVTRLVRPATRGRLLRPLAVAAPLALVPVLTDPPLAAVAMLAGLSGFAVGAAAPIANGQFVQALPRAYRARAFGVVQGGLQVLQGGAVLVTGALATGTPISLVVGGWSAGGLVLLLLVSLAWPAQSVFRDAIRSAEAADGSARSEAGSQVAGQHGVAQPGVARHEAGRPEAARHEAARPEAAWRTDRPAGHDQGPTMSRNGARVGRRLRMRSKPAPPH